MSNISYKFENIQIILYLFTSIALSKKAITPFSKLKSSTEELSWLKNKSCLITLL